MPYLGASLSAASTYMVECNGTAPCSVTVINIRRDRISEVESLVFDPAQATPETRSVGNNVGRIVFVIAGPVNSAGTFKVTQGTNRFEIPFSPDANAVFDIV